MKSLLCAVVLGPLLAVLAMPAWAINPPGEGRSPPIRPVPTPKSEISGEVVWERLLPKNERDHFTMIAPPPLHDYLSGDVGASQSGSAAVNAELEGVTIKLPGFIVPLTLTEAGRVSEFFLVPYAGACIHVPPPPPNQMVFVKLDKALELSALYRAYWVTGTLHTLTRNGGFAAAAYSMDARTVEPYKS